MTHARLITAAFSQPPRSSTILLKLNANLILIKNTTCTYYNNYNKHAQEVRVEFVCIGEPAKKRMELDKLYFPHEWQKRFPSDRVLEEHIKFFNNETEKIKKMIRCEFDVPYGFTAREKYDIFGLDLPEGSPILVHVHGGYWQVKEINHSNQGFLANILHKHNIKVIALGYELCPEVTIKDITIEIELAVKRCLDYAKRCKSRGIYLSGHSVGAHLVASLFSAFIQTLPYEDQSLIKGIFLSCGLYDLTPLVKTVINKSLKLTEESARELSPQYMHISSPSHIKFYVVVAEQDSPAFIEQGKKLYEKLKESGINSTFLELKGIDHFNAIEKVTEEDFEVTQLFIKVIE